MSWGFSGRPTFRGAGGRAGLSLVFRSGALAHLGLRGTGQRSRGQGLGRVRIGLGGGYQVRAGKFEMPIVAALGVEPWWVPTERPVAFGRAPVPLLGALLRLEPSFAITPRRRPLVLRFGVALELSVSGEFRDGVAVPVVRQAEDEPALFRVGGVEASGGLVFELRFRSKRRARP